MQGRVYNGARPASAMSFAEQYRQLNDEELLRIAGESNQLVPEAESCLQDELAKRGLVLDEVSADVSAAQQSSQ